MAGASDHWSVGPVDLTCWKLVRQKDMEQARVEVNADPQSLVVRLVLKELDPNVRLARIEQS